MNRILYQIPEKDQYALDKYFDARIPVSDFLYAVLTSNIVSICEHATEEQLMLLPQYVRYAQEHGTKGSWGSQTAVRAWVTEATNTRGAYAKRERQ